MEASPLARRAPLGTLKPGRVSARRAVPDHSARPDDMFHDGPARVTTSDSPRRSRRSARPGASPPVPSRPWAPPSRRA